MYVTANFYSFHNTNNTSCRFIDCEKWRKEFGPNGLDDLVQNFKYDERPEVFKYYPQYYHKTDKVSYSKSIRDLPLTNS
jgi:hypothetical protein